MSTRVQWSGLKELIQQLTDAPEDIRQDGLGILREEVEAAADEMRAAYPQGPTGQLRRSVKVDFPSSQILVGVVRNTAPHAHLYEFGTQRRETASGANRGQIEVGRAGGGGKPVTVPISRKHRREMFERMKAMLKDKGFEVTGG